MSITGILLILSVVCSCVCIFNRIEEQIMHATIQDCSLRDDGNVYPAFPPKCDECKNFRSFADVKKQMLGDYVEVVRCKDCKWWIPEKIEKTEWYISETGAHCGRVDSVNVHGYRDGEPSHDTTLLWMQENSFCSYGERK